MEPNRLVKNEDKGAISLQYATSNCGSISTGVSSICLRIFEIIVLEMPVLMKEIEK